jgi:pimeloyl-ACP methyl ester carboxylesterase
MEGAEPGASILSNHPPKHSLPYSALCDESAPRETLVVLLHGLFGSRVDMMQLAASLGDEFDTVAFDLPGHGDCGVDMLSGSDFAASLDVLKDIICELERLRLPERRVCLLGYSLGARLAMQDSCPAQRAHAPAAAAATKPRPRRAPRAPHAAPAPRRWRSGGRTS